MKKLPNSTWNKLRFCICADYSLSSSKFQVFPSLQTHVGVFSCSFSLSVLKQSLCSSSTFTPSLNQRGAVKLTPHHCPAYVITTACSLLPRQRSEECPRLIKTTDLIKTCLPPPPELTLTLFTLSQGDEGGGRPVVGSREATCCFMGPPMWNELRRCRKTSAVFTLNQIVLSRDSDMMVSHHWHEVSEGRNQNTLFGSHFSNKMAAKRETTVLRWCFNISKGETTGIHLFLTKTLLCQD